MNTLAKVIITVIAFFVAIAISSFALEFFMGQSYPAWTMVVALAIVSPVVFVLWRDRLT